MRSARALNASYKEQWHRMTSNASHDRESFSNACPRFIYSFQKSLWNHYKLHSSACSDNGLCFTREKRHSNYGILKFEDDFFRNAGQHTRIMHLFVAIRIFGVILKYSPALLGFRAHNWNWNDQSNPRLMRNKLLSHWHFIAGRKHRIYRIFERRKKHILRVTINRDPII